MTTFFEAVQPGFTRELGSHTFRRDDIIKFARQFDPQPFHLDDEAAKASLFGALCASGWHVTAAWMRLNVDHGRAAYRDGVAFDGEAVFGPSPGVRNLRWSAPVFPGDTVAFTSRVTGKRATPHRPGWGMLMGAERGVNQNGVTVVSFDSAVTVRTD